MKRAAAIISCVVACLLLVTPRADAAPAGGTKPGGTPAATLAEARRLIATGDFPGAEGMARALVREAEAAHGEDSIEVAEPLDVLVESLWRGDKWAEPETRRLAERAVAIRERSGDKDGLGVAQSLSNLGGLLRNLSDLAGARSACQRALAIREKILGPDHPDVAGALVNLSSVVAETGDMPGARAMCARALAIREKALGPDHAEVASACNSLGALDTKLGDYATALAELERALAIGEKALGPDHPDIGVTLRNLGNLTRMTGDYARGRSVLERSLAIAEKTSGPEGLATASSVSTLAILLTFMGDPVAAEAGHRRALAIWEKRLPPQHPQIGLALDNLASLLLMTGKPAEAQPLYARALPILEAALGPESRDVMVNLQAQAMALADMGDEQQSRKDFERVISIEEKILGPDHPELAEMRGNLGVLLKRMGEYPAARTNLERALRIHETVRGPGHPITAGTRDLLARVSWMQGRFEEGMREGLRAEKDTREQFMRAARLLSQREALMYEAVRSSGHDTVLTALLSEPGDGNTLADYPPAKRPSGSGPVESQPRPDRRRAAANAWDEEVRARAMVLDEMATRHRALAGRDDPALRPQVEALDTAREALARLSVKGPDPGGAEAFARGLQEAQAREDSAERALATSSAAFRQDRDRRQAGLAEVLAALPKGSALVAYVRYERLREMGHGDSVPSYLAFVARSGVARSGRTAADGGGVDVVPVGAVEDIDALVRAWHDEVSVDPRGAAAGPVAIPAAAGGASVARAGGAGAQLRAAIWDPVAGLVAGATTVFVVPDGAIDLVNLATLRANDGRYLLESGPTLHLLSAERDLVRPARAPAAGTAVLALGGADFDARIEADPASTPVAAVFRGAPASCSTFRSLKFDPLPGALAEAREVGSLWTKRKADVRLLTGGGADEAAFKRLAPGSRILHLATHGYFLEDDCESGDNPLVRSGLALAGANRRGEPRDPAEGEDGVLTGEEIAALDLSGVEWAVLSACETGVGKVQPGEGVLGLRRAFEIAGARTLVMSLWKVEDGATRLFMRELYDARASGLSSAESVRRAATKILAMQRAQGQPDVPYFWGAFVATGDWR